MEWWVRTTSETLSNTSGIPGKIVDEAGRCSNVPKNESILWAVRGSRPQWPSRLPHRIFDHCPKEPQRPTIMILHQFQYEEHSGKPTEWKLEPVCFGLVNLLVGKNSSGKTRTINVINAMARLLSGNIKMGFKSGDYIAHFRDGKDEYKYRLLIQDSRVELETFHKNTEPLLEREKGGVGRIFAAKAKEYVEFQTPDSELASVNRRDSIQHPFFEVLHEWAIGVRLFKFGTPLGKDSYVILNRDAQAHFDPRETDKVISVFKRGQKEFGEPFVEGIMSDMASIGYDLDNVGVHRPSGITVEGPMPGDFVGLFAEERDLDSPTEQHSMSQGMFRALSIIIQLNFSERSHQPSCILIDDIGEGLDFERSCSLIELTMSKTLKTNVQLLMSTNDRFVMNKVPLKHWALIQRRGNVCRVFNDSNSHAKFEEFRFTGMNNFDFFATNFIDSDPHEETGNIR